MQLRSAFGEQQRWAWRLGMTPPAREGREPCADSLRPRPAFARTNQRGGTGRVRTPVPGSTPRLMPRRTGVPGVR